MPTSEGAGVNQSGEIAQTFEVEALEATGPEPSGPPEGEPEKPAGSSRDWPVTADHRDAAARFKGYDHLRPSEERKP